MIQDTHTRNNFASRKRGILSLASTQRDVKDICSQSYKLVSEGPVLLNSCLFILLSETCSRPFTKWGGGSGRMDVDEAKLFLLVTAVEPETNQG